MSLNRVNLLLGLLCCVVFGVSEPSAFERQSGATKKDIKSLKDSSLNLSSVMTDLQNRVKSLEEVQYGLKSAYEGYSQQMQKMSEEIKNQATTLQELSGKFDVLKTQFEAIQEQSTKHTEELNKLVETLKDFENKMKEMTQVDVSLNELVLKEFGALREEIAKQASVVTKNQENIQKLGVEIEKIYTLRKQDAFKNPSKKAEVLKEAKSLYWKKQFDEAKMRFVWLNEQKYQGAEVNYFLGKLAFQEKKYQDAIFYYKQSATMNDKAKYMPVLLLQTAQAFQALKDKANALKFADSLLALYPKSKEAQEAKKIKTKLKGAKNGK